jgi:hypothetical protein
MTARRKRLSQAHEFGVKSERRRPLSRTQINWGVHSRGGLWHTFGMSLTDISDYTSDSEARGAENDMRWQRYRYHEGQARRLRGVMGSLIRHHEADRYARALGIEEESA